MTNLVTFPGLGLSFEINRVAFSIGGIAIYWYGIMIAVGIMLAMVFAFRHLQARPPKMMAPMTPP